MAVTISTHMGTEVRTEHNRRNKNITDKEKHIRPDGYHENWIDESPREAYERIFGKAVQDYNKSQKREDRRIKNYYNQIAKDAKKHVLYECIAGVYGDEVTEKEARAILSEYVEEWKKQNPNMIVIGAYYHADEDLRSNGYHCHIDFVPIAHGYKKGLSVRTSISKGLDEQGVHMRGRKSQQEVWTRMENDRLEHICNKHGLEVIHPMRDKGVEHKKIELYKVEKSIEQKQTELQQAKKAVKHAQTELQAVQRFNDMIRNQLEQSKKRLESDIERKKKQLEKLQTDLQEHSEQSERLQDDIKRAESRLSVLQAKDQEIHELVDNKLQTMQQLERLAAMQEWISKAKIKDIHGDVVRVKDGFERYLAQLDRESDRIKHELDDLDRDDRER